MMGNLLFHSGIWGEFEKLSKPQIHPKFHYAKTRLISAYIYIYIWIWDMTPRRRTVAVGRHVSSHAPLPATHGWRVGCWGLPYRRGNARVFAQDRRAFSASNGEWAWARPRPAGTPLERSLVATGSLSPSPEVHLSSEAGHSNGYGCLINGADVRLLDKRIG
jgi:hypothetical protein